MNSVTRLQPHDGSITEAMCRICLESIDDVVTIYANNPVSEDNSKIYQQIEQCVGGELMLAPGLPTRICKSCKQFLDFVLKFRALCQRSEQYIRQYAFKSEVVDEPQYLDESDAFMENYKHSLSLSDEEGVDDDEEYLSIADSGESNRGVVIATEKMHYSNSEEGDENTRYELTDEAKSQLKEPPTDAVALSRTAKTASTHLEDSACPIQHVCYECGNMYTRKSVFDEHMRRHRKELRFECEICHRKFQLNFQLKRHMRMHTGLRPFACTCCDRRFADRSSLVKHERTHRNERPFKCSTCSKSFSYANVLKAHMLTHTGEKPHKCEICDKRFAQMHHLRAHLSTQMHQGYAAQKQLLENPKSEQEQQ